MNFSIKEFKVTQLLTEKISIFEQIFLYLFLLYSLLSSNNITYGTRVITFVMYASFLVGAVILAQRIICFNQYFKYPGLVYLLFMLISICLSTVLNYQYSLKTNLVFCIYWLFYFAVIYLIEAKKGTLLIFLKVFSLIISLAVLVSLTMMFMHYSSVVVRPDTGYIYYQGFAIGRLWGVFINPNNAADTAALVVIVLLYLFLNTKLLWKKIVYVFVGLMDVFFIALTDSRSGALCFGISLGVFVFVNVFTKKNTYIYKALIVFLCLLIVVLGFVTPRKVKDGYNFVLTKIAIIKSEKDTTDFDGSEELLIDRGYDLSGDISNRRFDAWKSAIEVYASSLKVVLFGASFGGFTEYARENLPSTYIVNNDYGDFTTLDNEFFNILDSQGTFGALAFILFVVFVLFYIFRRVWKSHDIQLMALLVALLFGLASSACFGGVMFYHFSQNTILFWTILGGLVSLLEGEKAIEN